MIESAMMAQLDALLSEIERVKDPAALVQYHGAEPFTLEWLEHCANETHKDLVLLETEEITPRDVSLPFDLKLVGGVRAWSRHETEEELLEARRTAAKAGSQLTHSWQRVRIRAGSEALKMCRIVSKKYPTMARVDMTIPSATDPARARHNALFAGWVGSKWKYVGDGSVDRHWVKELDTLRSIRMALRIGFSRRYHWRVVLGYEGRPGLSFVTDPTGVLETFQNREIPGGRSRRQALLHWVEQHWRRSRVDPDALHRVRAHLRGARTFKWNDLLCTVHESEFDKELVGRDAPRPP